MYTPRRHNQLAPGVLWAADTGCFKRPQDYDESAYLAWLADDMGAGRDRCLFATAPDVRPEFSADPAGDTLTVARPVLDKIRAIGYPAALCAQDGIEHFAIPWDEFDALFIGGSDDWKLSGAATALIAEAKRRGKWAHQGRVNSYKRLRIVEGQNADSADGTFIAFAPDLNERRAQKWLDKVAAQPRLFRVT